jgi:hypothetical protein
MAVGIVATWHHVVAVFIKRTGKGEAAKKSRSATLSADQTRARLAL